MFRIENIRTSPDFNLKDLPGLLCRKLHIPDSRLEKWYIVRRAIDARKKRRIEIVYTVDISFRHESAFLKSYAFPPNLKVKQVEPFVYKISEITRKPEHQPVIAGSGPCGLFAALVLAESGFSPVILERGRPVSERVQEVNRFMQKGVLNPESNIPFGEGGAGTFSDGKLYTLIKDPRTKRVFDTLIQSGAPPEIAYDARPHIGTDNLRRIIPSLRQRITRAGGEFRFSSKLTDMTVEGNAIQSVRINGAEEIETDDLILAIGHSARDTVEMLHNDGLEMAQKAFSIGVRIEHKRKWIDTAQFGDQAGHPNLGAGRYKLSIHLENGRGVYTFCMCPGGTVVPAASEPEHLVTNGMSEYARNQVNSNSAVLVSITPSDFKSDHPLAGMTFQREWESRAFQLTGSNYYAPVQRFEDFMHGRESIKWGKVTPSYLPGTVPAPLQECLPDFVAESLKAGICHLDRKLRGFAHPDALLTGVETRSSAPYRILRDEQFQSNIRGIYPAGEGAGYAGGIVSSAVDGMKIAEAVIASYRSRSFRGVERR